MIDPSGNDHYYAHDHLYSPVALIADNGTVEERYEYDAYGKCTIWDATFTNTRSTSLYDNDRYFTGQMLDVLDNNTLFIMYYKNRHYLPDIGRFIQCDMLGTIINPIGEIKNIQESVMLAVAKLLYPNRTKSVFFSNDKNVAPRKIYNDKNQQTQKVISALTIIYYDSFNLYEYVASRPTCLLDGYGLTWVRGKKVWECPDPGWHVKTACNCLKKVPYFKNGARSLEMKWCTVCLYKCTLFCIEQDTVNETKCLKACSACNASCLKKGAKPECDFEFAMYLWRWIN